MFFYVMIFNLFYMITQNENHLPQALTDRNAMWWRNLRMCLFNSSLLFSFFFFFVIIQSQFYNYYSFNHIPDEVILSRSLYSVPDLTTKFPQIIFTPYYFTQYQFYPFYLRFFIKICASDSWFALPIASLFQNLIVTASFYIMLSTCNIVNNPAKATYIFSIYPFAFIIQRNIALPGALCFSFECLAFAFLKKKKIFLSSICCCCAILTSFQGFIISFSILTFLVFKKKIYYFLIVLFATSFALLVLMAESEFLYKDRYAFIKELKNEFFSTRLFESFKHIREKRPLYYIFEIILSYILPSLAGAIKLRSISLPHFLYCIYSLIFLISFKKDDIEYYVIGLATFSVIIGFDEFLTWVLNLIPNSLIFIIVEIVIYFLAAHFLKYHAVEQKYVDYAMSLQSSLISI